MANPQYKLITLGDTTVGKTAISIRLTKNVFYDKTFATIGAVYNSIKLDNYSIGLWDTAGQERYLSLINIYYRNTFVYLMIYDLSDLDTVKRIFYYLNIIKDLIEPDSVILIIGNKMDLISDNIEDIDKTVRKMVNSELEKCDISNKVEYYYVSALSGENINALYDGILRVCNDKYNILTTTNGKNASKNTININNVTEELSFSKYCQC